MEDTADTLRAIAILHGKKWTYYPQFSQIHRNYRMPSAGLLPQGSFRILNKERIS
ncbi:MAG: hypothetical protein LUP94_04055 [Candidatus Methanomethylicus sp.]|nr:hypothetical protein [Candidatus Methanomethylicus sp.]